MAVSGSNFLEGSGVNTSVFPLIAPGNYPGILVTSYTPATNKIFVTDGEGTANDVRVSIDRTNYSPSATIKLLISTI
jgi:hypothetical protein